MHNFSSFKFEIEFFISLEITFKLLFESSFKSLIEFSSNSNTFESSYSFSILFEKYPLAYFLVNGILEELKINL